jgi:predicted ATPase/transcriptional regulator with XRE-family HTH domain
MAVQHQETASAFGPLLRQHRTAIGLSQEALAERAGLSPRTVSDLERGIKTRPHPATLRLLADALELGADERGALAAASRPGRAAPTPTTAPTRPVIDTLPLPTSPIIGRDDELAIAVGLLRSGDARLVTVTGPGGVGKTRLSLEIARTLAPEMVDGGAMVELGPIADPSLVVPAVAATLGLRETSDRPPSEAVRDHLRTRRMLLVLDNCEHLLEHVATLVADLLATAPGLRVIASSRPPLRIRGEHVLALAPLALPAAGEPVALDAVARVPAIALFVERARAVRPDFALTSGNAADIVAICARLDGLPLAIELAAIRLRALTPAALVSLLSERLRVLTAGPHDAPERHRTLRAAIEWSHDLLSDDQQALFRRLAVFAGGCSLEAAAAVATDDDPFAALDGLEALVDQGLATRDDASAVLRFGMLETVREYAQERLRSSEEAEAVAARHAAHLLGLAELAGQMLHGREPRVWLDRLEREQDNLRAALAWSLGEAGGDGDPVTALRLAAALWPYWHMRGHFQEGHGWLERAIARAGEVDPAARAAAFHTLANVANNLEDHARAERLYTESLRLSETLDDQDSAAAALVGLGMVATNRGDFDRARDLLNRAHLIIQERGDGIAGVPCLYALGRLAIAAGDLDAADAHYAEIRRLSDPDNIGVRAYLDLEAAQIARYRGDLEHAASRVESCLGRFREIGERRAEATSLAELGHLALLRGDMEHASALLRQAAELHVELHDELGLTRCLEGYAALTAREEPNLAARLIGVTDAWRERIGTARLPAERALHRQAVDTARDALGEERFAALSRRARTDDLATALVWCESLPATA